MNKQTHRLKCFTDSKGYALQLNSEIEKALPDIENGVTAKMIGGKAALLVVNNKPSK